MRIFYCIYENRLEYNRSRMHLDLNYESKKARVHFCEVAFDRGASVDHFAEIKGHGTFIVQKNRLLITFSKLTCQYINHWYWLEEPEKIKLIVETQVTKGFKIDWLVKNQISIGYID